MLGWERENGPSLKSYRNFVWTFWWQFDAAVMNTRRKTVARRNNGRANIDSQRRKLQRDALPHRKIVANQAHDKYRLRKKEYGFRNNTALLFKRFQNRWGATTKLVKGVEVGEACVFVSDKRAQSAWKGIVVAAKATKNGSFRNRNHTRILIVLRGGELEAVEEENARTQVVRRHR